MKRPLPTSNGLGKGPPPLPEKQPVSTSVQRLYSEFPSVGLVVSTYGSPAYVALHLESRNQFCPDVPCLVVDDCSEETGALVDLCAKYGAAFISNPRKLGHLNGDLSALVHGLQWARCWGIDLLVKMSRRFLPLDRWVDDLASLAVSSQYPTFSNRCDHYKFKFRSECFAVHPGSWWHYLPELLQGTNGDHVENYLHRVCQRVPLCRLAARYSPEERGYAQWEYLGTDRHKHPPQWLWHDCVAPQSYWAMARQWELRYGMGDFEVNQ